MLAVILSGANIATVKQKKVVKWEIIAALALKQTI